MSEILTPGFAMTQRLPQFDDFKARYPDQIASKLEEERFNPNKEDWFLIACICNAINNCCGYVKENKDYWRIMTDLADTGDCEDFVFTKRFLIDKAGFSLNCFVPVICRTGDSKGHMVLCIRTVEGDLISDNIIQHLFKPENINYKYDYMLINDTWRMVI